MFVNMWVPKSCHGRGFFSGPTLAPSRGIRTLHASTTKSIPLERLSGHRGGHKSGCCASPCGISGGRREDVRLRARTSASKPGTMVATTVGMRYGVPQRHISISKREQRHSSRAAISFGDVQHFAEPTFHCDGAKQGTCLEYARGDVNVSARPGWHQTFSSESLPKTAPLKYASSAKKLFGRFGRRAAVLGPPICYAKSFPARSVSLTATEKMLHTIMLGQFMG